MADTNDSDTPRSCQVLQTVLSLTITGLFLYLIIQFFTARNGLRSLGQQCVRVAQDRQGVQQSLEQLYNQTCSAANGGGNSALCQSLAAAIQQQQRHQDTVWRLCQNIQQLQ